MSQHTPEPWVVNGSHIESENEHGWVNDGWIIADLSGSQIEANARRIVACVNACAGASTEVLEKGAIHDWALLMTQLESQNAELLVTLRSIAESYPTTEEGETLAGIARDALTKMEGTTDGAK